MFIIHFDISFVESYISSSFIQFKLLIKVIVDSIYFCNILNSYLNKDKEYQENELLKELNLPSNLKVDDFSIFEVPQGMKEELLVRV